MPPHPPVSQKTDKRAVIGFVLSIVSLLAGLSEGSRNSDYRGNVPEGIGANLFPFLIAVVAMILAISAVRGAPQRGQRGKGLAITGIVLAALTMAGCVLRILALIGTSA
jgi:hypothetical protein